MSASPALPLGLLRQCSLMVRPEFAKLIIAVRICSLPGYSVISAMPFGLALLTFYSSPALRFCAGQQQQQKKRSSRSTRAAEEAQQKRAPFERANFLAQQQKQKRARGAALIVPVGASALKQQKQQQKRTRA